MVKRCWVKSGKDEWMHKSAGRNLQVDIKKVDDYKWQVYLRKVSNNRILHYDTYSTKKSAVSGAKKLMKKKCR